MIISSMLKKLLASFLLFAVVVVNLALPSVASAQNWWAPTPQDFNQRVNDPAIPPNEIFGERYTQAQVYWIIYSIQNFVFGTEVMECAANAGGTLAAFATCDAFEQLGLLGQSNVDVGVFSLSSVINGFSQKPASGVGYITYLSSKVGLPIASAQEGGFGFSTALQPLLTIWTAARNAAYALMTLAVIILAFMVMFRTRISPQASVTVQSAIPRVIIGLLLITFSYAIAGFVIDLSYVVQGVIAALLSTSGLIDEGSGWDVVDIFNQMNDVGAGVVAYGLVVIAWALVGGLTGGAISAIVTGGGAILVAGVIVIIALIIFLIAFVKIFWVMLRTYVMVLFHVIALPFAALGYVASPSGNMFMSLLRSLIGHVSIFVTITVVVMFAHLMFWNMSGANYSALGGSDSVTIGLFNPYRANAQNAFTSPGGGLPGFGATDMSGMGIFIGLVILLMGPSVANNIKSFIITGRGDREGFSMVGIGAGKQVLSIGGDAYAARRSGKVAAAEYAMKTAGTQAGYESAAADMRKEQRIAGIIKGLTKR